MDFLKPRKLLLPNGQQVEVVLDAGHGGIDPGAVHPGRKTRETDICHPATQLLAFLLRLLGIKATETPVGFLPNNVKYSLHQRKEFANSTKAVLFVSIHANASIKHNAEGSEVFYFSSGKKLATAIAPALAVIPKRDRGAKQANFYVLRKTKMPAVLLELGFVDDADNDDFDDTLWLITHWPLQMSAVAVIIYKYIMEVYVNPFTLLVNSDNERLGSLNTIELSALQKLNPTAVEYSEAEATLKIIKSELVDHILYQLDDMRVID